MKVICVDDELPVLDNFRMKLKDLKEVEKFNLFSSAKDA